MISQPVLFALLASRGGAIVPPAAERLGGSQPWPVNDILLGAMLGRARPAEEIATLCGVTPQEVAHRIARIG